MGLDSGIRTGVKVEVVDSTGKGVATSTVYSASEYASNELPDLDVSIARRLQAPLAELVKIDPKSIGVGHYQHDVNQSLLAKKLDAAVEDCVNSVGVDVNLAPDSGAFGAGDFAVGCGVRQIGRASCRERV